MEKFEEKVESLRYWCKKFAISQAIIFVFSLLMANGGYSKLNLIGDTDYVTFYYVSCVFKALAISFGFTWIITLFDYLICKIKGKKMYKNFLGEFVFMFIITLIIIVSYIYMNKGLLEYQKSLIYDGNIYIHYYDFVSLIFSIPIIFISLYTVLMLIYNYICKKSGKYSIKTTRILTVMLKLLLFLYCYLIVIDTCASFIASY